MQPSLRPLSRSALSLISTRHGVCVYFSTHKPSSKSGPVCHSGTFTQWNLYESKPSNWIRIRRLCHCTYNNINSVCIKTLTNVSLMSPIDDSWSWKNLISRTIVGYKQKGKINKHSNASRFNACDIWSTEKHRACMCWNVPLEAPWSAHCEAVVEGSVWQLAPAHAEKMSIWASALNPNVMSMPIVSSVSNVINEPASFGPGAKKYLPRARETSH